MTNELVAPPLSYRVKILYPAGEEHGASALFLGPATLLVRHDSFTLTREKRLLPLSMLLLTGYMWVLRFADPPRHDRMKNYLSNLGSYVAQAFWHDADLLKVNLWRKKTFIIRTPAAKDGAPFLFVAVRVLEGDIRRLNEILERAARRLSEVQQAQMHASDTTAKGVTEASPPSEQEVPPAAQATFADKPVAPSPWHWSAKGAATAARIGVIMWLVIAFFRFISIEDFLRGGLTFWLLVITVLWIRPFLPKSSQVYRAFQPGPLAGGIAAMLFTLSRFPGFTLKGSMMMLGLACQVATGAMIAGAAVCVWPGLLIGSLLGLFRHKSQTATKKKAIIVRGVVLPAIVFPLVVVLYVVLLSYLNRFFETSWFK